MRSAIAISLLAMVVGCSKKDAAEEVRKEAEELDRKETEANKGKIPETVRPPVTNEAKIPCEQLIDPVAFQTAVGETDPMTVKESREAEAAASCSLIKGGKPLTKKEMDARSKKQGLRLGVLPGDEYCNVSAFCYTVETAEGFQARCKQRGVDREDSSMGNYACVKVVAQGADDVMSYRFFDEDTRCILQVRGGPSQVDNDKILACAKAARDSITPDRIRVDAPPPPK